MTDQNSNNSDKKKLIELAFEQFETPAFFTAKKSVQSQFANGKTSGLVVEAGSDFSQIVPISDGYVIHKNMMNTQFGGECFTKKIYEEIVRLTNGMIYPIFDLRINLEKGDKKDVEYQLLDNVHESVREFHRLDIARDIKESFCKILVNKHDM